MGAPISLGAAPGFAELAVVKKLLGAKHAAGEVVSGIKFTSPSTADRWLNDTSWWLRGSVDATFLTPTMGEWSGTASMIKRNSIDREFVKGRQAISGVFHLT